MSFGILQTARNLNRLGPRTDPVVKTSSGSLRGVAEGNVSSFKEIPFAAKFGGEEYLLSLRYAYSIPANVEYTIEIIEAG